MRPPKPKKRLAMQGHFYYGRVCKCFGFVIYKVALARDIYWGFPGGAAVENLPANAEDMGSSPGLGRSHMPQSS